MCVLYLKRGRRYTLPDTKDKRNTKVINEKVMEDKRSVAKNKKRRVIIISFAVVAVVLLIIFFATGAYESFLDFLGVERDVSAVPTITEVSAEFRGEIHLAGTENVSMIYDEQGVTGYDKSGKWIWNEACSVKNPMICKGDDYILIADLGGTAIYTFNKDGAFWKYGIKNNIISVFCKGDYVGVIHEEDEYLSAVTLLHYDKNIKGMKEDFTRKISNHYMLTGAISPDYKQIALSGVYSEGGDACGIISFIKMSNGETFANEVIEDSVYVKLSYSNNNTVFASNSDSIYMVKKELSVSSANDKSLECWNRNNNKGHVIDTEMLSDGSLIAAIVGDSPEKSSVKKYDKEGKESMSIEINGKIIGMDSKKENFLVYTNTHVFLYNSKGQLIFSQEAGFEIVDAIYYGEKCVAIYTREKMLSISYE